MSYVQSKHLFESIEVTVAMQELVKVFQAEGSDPAIDRFENGVAGLA